MMNPPIYQTAQVTRWFKDYGGKTLTLANTQVFTDKPTKREHALA
ncbi:hypothetical protein Q4491_19155 [Photobacterium sp. 2_MG-2023]|nr:MULTISPECIES: hypothetical protein [Photobacterium]MDO6583462.1 hypothetical protein [Photobacterium sp. 2_MG-2023]